MSDWKRFDIETKIKNILSKEKVQGVGNSLGRSYVTIYQIAIEFEKDYPDITKKLGFDENTVGGKDMGQHNSLTQYLALQLGKHIKELEWLDGGSISNYLLKDIVFENNIQSSLTTTGYPLSIFRLCEKKS
jgi:hypothetical protein